MTTMATAICPRWCVSHQSDQSEHDDAVVRHCSADIYWSDERAGALVQIRREDAYGTSIPAAIYITDGDKLADGLHDITVDEARTLGEALQLLAGMLDQDSVQSSRSPMNRR